MTAPITEGASGGRRRVDLVAPSAQAGVHNAFTPMGWDKRGEGQHNRRIGTVSCTSIRCGDLAIGVVASALQSSAEHESAHRSAEGLGRNEGFTFTLHGGQCRRVARLAAIGSPRRRQTILALSRPPTILTRVSAAGRDSGIAGGRGCRGRWAEGRVHGDQRGTSRARPCDSTRNANVRIACAQRPVHAVRQEVGSTAAACIAASRSSNGASLHGDSRLQSSKRTALATHRVEKPRASVDTRAIHWGGWELHPSCIAEGSTVERNRARMGSFTDASPTHRPTPPRPQYPPVTRRPEEIISSNAPTRVGERSCSAIAKSASAASWTDGNSGRWR